jgi:hypothetical protein
LPSAASAHTFLRDATLFEYVELDEMRPDHPLKDIP